MQRGERERRRHPLLPRKVLRGHEIDCCVNDVQRPPVVAARIDPVHPQVTQQGTVEAVEVREAIFLLVAFVLAARRAEKRAYQAIAIDAVQRILVDADDARRHEDQNCQRHDCYYNARPRRMFCLGRIKGEGQGPVDHDRQPGDQDDGEDRRRNRCQRIQAQILTETRRLDAWRRASLLMSPIIIGAATIFAKSTSSGGG
jgi:PAS domain-containing protein